MNMFTNKILIPICEKGVKNNIYICIHRICLLWIIFIFIFLIRKIIYCTLLPHLLCFLLPAAFFHQCNTLAVFLRWVFFPRIKIPVWLQQSVGKHILSALDILWGLMTVLSSAYCLRSHYSLSSLNLKVYVISVQCVVFLHLVIIRQTKRLNKELSKLGKTL